MIIIHRFPNDLVNIIPDEEAEEHDTYFEKLGFDSAYTLWNRIDKGLGQIFDTEDTVWLEKLINDYQVKYGNIFSFNTIDFYNVTFYFTFTNNELSLVGNIKGYVVIDNMFRFLYIV